MIEFPALARADTFSNCAGDEYFMSYCKFRHGQRMIKWLIYYFRFIESIYTV